MCYSLMMRLAHLTFIGILTVIYGGVGFANFVLTPEDAYVDVTTWMDQWVSFTPAFVWPYLFYYFLMGTPLVIRLAPTELKYLWKRLAWASAFSALLFLLFPTKPLRFDGIAEMTGASAWVLRWLYYIDPPSNCFPSLHVLHSWLIALTYWKITSSRRTRVVFGILFGIMAAAVSVSTVFIKQHFVVDVFASIAMIPAVLWVAETNFEKLKRDIYAALGFQSR